MNTARLILTAAIGLAINSTVSAQDRNPNGSQRPFVRGMIFAHMLHQADTDGDGTLNEAERKAAREASQNRRDR